MANVLRANKVALAYTQDKSTEDLVKENNF